MKPGPRPSAVAEGEASAAVVVAAAIAETAADAAAVAADGATAGRHRVLRSHPERRRFSGGAKDLAQTSGTLDRNRAPLFNDEIAALSCCHVNSRYRAPVAQLDRAVASAATGRGLAS